MKERVYIYIPPQFRDRNYLGKNIYSKPVNIPNSNRAGVAIDKRVKYTDNTSATINYLK